MTSSNTTDPEKTQNALNAIKDFGFEQDFAAKVLESFLVAHSDDWTFIEDENYAVLVQAIHEAQVAFPLLDYYGSGVPGPSSSSRRGKPIDAETGASSEEPSPSTLPSPTSERDVNCKRPSSAQLKEPEVEPDLLPESNYGDAIGVEKQCVSDDNLYEEKAKLERLRKWKIELEESAKRVNEKERLLKIKQEEFDKAKRNIEATRSSLKRMEMDLEQRVERKEKELIEREEKLGAREKVDDMPDQNGQEAAWVTAESCGDFTVLNKVGDGVASQGDSVHTGRKRGFAQLLSEMEKDGSGTVSESISVGGGGGLRKRQISSTADVSMPGVKRYNLGSKVSSRLASESISVGGAGGLRKQHNSSTADVSMPGVKGYNLRSKVLSRLASTTYVHPLFQKATKKCSEVWDHFTLDELDKLAECNYCTKRLRGDQQAGTSHLWRHWNTFHKEEINQEEDDEPISKVKRKEGCC